MYGLSVSSSVLMCIFLFPKSVGNKKLRAFRPISIYTKKCLRKQKRACDTFFRVN